MFLHNFIKPEEKWFKKRSEQNKKDDQKVKVEKKNEGLWLSGLFNERLVSTLKKSLIIFLCVLFKYSLFLVSFHFDFFNYCFLITKYDFTLNFMTFFDAFKEFPLKTVW